MNKNIFVYGETGSGKTLFAKYYGKENLIDIPKSKLKWNKAYKSIKDKITDKSIFLWDFFEQQSRCYMNWYLKLDILRPNRSHIICSLYSPNHYSFRIQEFLRENDFIIIHLEDNKNTETEIIKEHIKEIVEKMKIM